MYRKCGAWKFATSQSEDEKKWRSIGDARFVDVCRRREWKCTAQRLNPGEQLDPTAPAQTAARVLISKPVYVPLSPDVAETVRRAAAAAAATETKQLRSRTMTAGDLSALLQSQRARQERSRVETFSAEEAAALEENLGLGIPSKVKDAEVLQCKVCALPRVGFGVEPCS